MNIIVNTTTNMQDTIETTLDENNLTSYTGEPDESSVEQINELSVKTDHMKHALIDYLSRPLLLFSGTFPNAVFFNVFSVADWFANSDIMNKLKYFQLLRGTFEFKILINPDPYATGQLIFGPYYGNYDHINAEGTDESKITSISTRKFGILDTANCTSGVCAIPLLTRKFALDVANVLDDTELPFLQVGSLTPIYSTQSGSRLGVPYRIFVRMVNPELSIPVPSGTNLIYTSAVAHKKKHKKKEEIIKPVEVEHNEIQETSDGMISYPATMVAKMAGKFKDVPVIGKYAYATELAANAASKLAVMFGFSRPKDISSVPYPHVEDLTSYVGNIRTKGLSLDPLQEIPIDNSWLATPGDPLSFDSLIKQYSVLFSSGVLTTMNTGTVLFNIPVTPSFCYKDSLTCYAPTRLAYISQMYNIWRGGITFKLVIPTNKYVRSKLRLIWTPNSLDSTFNLTVAIQNAYSVLIDVTSQNEVEFTVPFASNDMFKNVSNLMSFNTYPTLATDGVLQYYINGFVSLVVEDELQVPANSYVMPYVLYIKAADDFEFGYPSNTKINYLSQQPTPGVAPLPYPNGSENTTVLPANTDVIYQTRNHYLLQYTSQVEPMNIGAITIDAGMSTVEAFAQTMGESFNSVRPVLKRFCPWYTRYTINGTTNKTLNTYLPILPGPRAAVDNLAPFDRNTFLKHVLLMFYGYRGTIRHRYRIFHVTLSNKLDLPNITVFRDKNLVDTWFDTFESTDADTDMINHMIESEGFAEYYVKNGEQVIVDIPHQFPKLIQRTETIVERPTGMQALVMQMHDPSRGHDAYLSVGEDFSPIYDLGVPLVYQRFI